METYIDKVARYAYRVIDSDIEEILGAGYSEDVVFEITLSAALGAGMGRLERGLSARALGTESALTLVACPRAECFRRYAVPDPVEVTGDLIVNPLYDVERRNGKLILTLRFPTPEYEAEFGACRRYLPDTVTMDADLTGRLEPAMLEPRYQELRRRRVLIDAPPRYC